MDNSDQMREAGLLFAEAKEFIAALRQSSAVRRFYSCIILLVISLMTILQFSAYDRTGHLSTFSITSILTFPYEYAIAVTLYILFSITQLFRLYRMDRHQYHIEQGGADPKLVVEGIIDAYALAIELSSANHRRHYRHICRVLIALAIALLVSTAFAISGLNWGIW